MSLARWQIPPDPAEDLASSRTPDETRLHFTAAILNYGGAALAGWLVFYSWPYEFVFAMAAIAPLLGIALVRSSGGYVRFVGDGTHPGLLFMFGLIPFALTIASDKQRLIEVIDVVPSIILAGIGILAVVWSLPASRREPLLLGCAALLVGFYGFGVLSFINIQGDAATPERLRTIVMDLSAPSRRGSLKIPMTYTVRVREFEMLKITRADFMNLRVGDPICVSVHPGLFGMRWVETFRCA